MGVPMRATAVSIAAYSLGNALQHLRWKAFQEDYQRKRDQIASDLDEIGLQLEVPATIEEFLEAHDDLFMQIHGHLTEERSRLGGDVSGLTFFMFGYLPFELVLAAALRPDRYEPLLRNLLLVLRDLGIAGEYETIKGAIDTETAWLAQQAQRQEGNVEIADAVKAELRLSGRIRALWAATQKHGETSVRFDDLPYHSVFLSYSTADEEFCLELYESLADAGLRVWFAPHDIKPGRRIASQVSRAIEQYDKLLIVLSEASMESDWVATELYKACTREQTQSVQVLFPIRLVPFEKIRAWQAFDADSGRDMARELRQYYIPDFTDWRDTKVYAARIDQLIGALMLEEPGAQQSG
jgi:TIR domain